jgi:hypothetical protein
MGPADRVFPVAEALAPPPQCMPCGVRLLMATLIAGHGAEGERREPWGLGGERVS